MLGFGFGKTVSFFFFKTEIVKFVKMEERKVGSF